jgi:RNA polymerase sigma-70 factor, ECF subfamily
VLGGGAVGAELGQVFARFAARVTVVEARERLLPMDEPEAGDLLASVFTREGIAVRTAAPAERVSHDGRRFAVDLAGGETITGQRLLVAAGRRANLAALGVAAYGIDETARAIATDQRMRAADGLWAIGDITGKGAFTHVSMYQAAIAVADILGQDGTAADYRAVPRVTFTDLWAHKTKPAAPPGRIEGDETLRQRAGDHTVHRAPAGRARLDAESAEWLQVLAGTGPRREAGLARLHERLLRIARGEAARRAPRLAISGPELDDVACQAAADALLAITAKIGQFRGESRFITWAYKFVIFEVSAKIGRHFWRHPVVRLDAEDWDRLPARFGFDPAHQAEWRDLLAALRRAVDTELTPRQREVFVAIVLNGVPLDALVLSLASSRNAIYKMLFDARRKLRAALAANGYLPDDFSRRS